MVKVAQLECRHGKALAQLPTSSSPCRTSWFAATPPATTWAWASQRHSITLSPLHIQRLVACTNGSAKHQPLCAWLNLHCPAFMNSWLKGSERLKVYILYNRWKSAKSQRAVNCWSACSTWSTLTQMLHCHLLKPGTYVPRASRIHEYSAMITWNYKTCRMISACESLDFFNFCP